MCGCFSYNPYSSSIVGLKSPPVDYNVGRISPPAMHLILSQNGTGLTDTAVKLPNFINFFAWVLAGKVTFLAVYFFTSMLLKKVSALLLSTNCQENSDDAWTCLLWHFAYRGGLCSIGDWVKHCKHLTTNWASLTYFLCIYWFLSQIVLVPPQTAAVKCFWLQTFWMVLLSLVDPTVLWPDHNQCTSLCCKPALWLLLS
jgi:hypothetical protein